MVLTTRNITAVTVPINAYERQPQVVLEHVSGAKLIGLLKQIGELSDFAAEIFDNLLKDATSTASRVSSLGARMSVVESQIPLVASIYASRAPSHFYGGVVGDRQLTRAAIIHEFAFVAETLPAPIARARELAQSPPLLASMDRFVAQNPGGGGPVKSCLSVYSDPSFFVTQWSKNEEEKAMAQMAEKQALRAARKGKKGGKKKKKGQLKVVATVQLKTYSAQGKEFAAAQPAYQPQTQTLASPEENEDDDEGRGTSASPLPTSVSPPMAARPLPLQPAQSVAPITPARPAAPSPIHQQQAQAYVPPPASPYGVPPPAQPPQQPQRYLPPPPIASIVSPGAPPPPAAPAIPIPQTRYAQPPAPPAPPAAPNAPAMSYAPPPPAPPQAPMAPGPPSAPGPPQAPGGPTATASRGSSNGGGGGMGNGLLDAIRGGGVNSLKKATVAAAAAPTGRSGLMGQINSKAFALKNSRASIDQAPPQQAAKPTMISGAAASIAAVLARRSAISGDDSDSGGDSEDEWD